MKKKKSPKNKTTKKKRVTKKKISKAKKRQVKVGKLTAWLTFISISVCLLIREYPAYLNFDTKKQLNGYNATINRIQQEQLGFQKRWIDQPAQRSSLRENAQEYIYSILTDSIFKYWYGTEWDFNGTTAQPGKGMIACGYFVTTTLEHCCFRLPRVKLAQQAASVIIRSLCETNSIRTFKKLSLLKNYMDNKKTGIYVLGLDTHVGFLWKSEAGLYFVHSSYSGKKQVSKEKWNKSQVILKSKILVVGDFIGNINIIDQWIQNKEISIQK
ncbi:MAG: hypothetical protein MK207_13460 [Saprospiraceae bacterium]|nr:hypothetical protein [Saprospiraceae bacterium]